MISGGKRGDSVFTPMNLGLHGGRIGGIFITGIFTLSGGGEFLTFKMGIPGGLDFKFPGGLDFKFVL